MRTSKQLLIATRDFVSERRWLSWWHFWSTIVVMTVLLVLDSAPIHWLYRLPFSILTGFVVVRCFVLYHDQQHGSFLRGSKIAQYVLHGFSLAALNPPSVWKRSHDHHHVHSCKAGSRNVGSYPLMTTTAYQDASRWERIEYRASRHPLTILSGYFTVFFFRMCVCPLLANPKRHLDAAFSILLHTAILIWLVSTGNQNIWLVGVIPCTIGSALGAYLFYAQHNFPGAKIRSGRDWNYVSAALEASSHLQMGAILNWFTGNIGYHHVHHLNGHIPFYRLPEAMAAMDELQSPIVTTLRPRDILACFRMNLWNPATEQFVSWSQLSKTQHRCRQHMIPSAPVTPALSVDGHLATLSPAPALVQQ